MQEVFDAEEDSGSFRCGSRHEKLEAQWPALFKQAGWTTPYLAMDSMTGPPEVWFVSPFDSFAALEKDNKDFEKNAALKAETEKLSEKDGEFISGGRSFVAIYRPDLSRNPNVDIATMRYFRIATGVPAYMVWTPMKSLDELDAIGANARALAGTEGEEGQKALAKLTSDGIASIESQIYAFNPKMSYPPKDFATRGGDFWTPKPAARVAAKGEAKKGAKKEEAKPAEKK